MAVCPAAQMGFIRGTKLHKKEHVVHPGKDIDNKRVARSTKPESKHVKKQCESKERKHNYRTSAEGHGVESVSNVKPVPVEFTVRILGSRSSGKTTLMNKIASDKSVSNKRTNISTGSELDETITVTVENEKEAIIRLLDLPECENHAVATFEGFLHPTVVAGQIDLYLVVYSIVDFSSVIFARACLRQLQKSTSGMASFKRIPPAVILVANKVDLDLAQSSFFKAQATNLTVASTEGPNLAKEHCCKFAQVSSLTGLNCPMLLSGIIRQLHIRHDLSTDNSPANRFSRVFKTGTLGRCFGLSNVGECDDLFSQ